MTTTPCMKLAMKIYKFSQVLEGTITDHKLWKVLIGKVPRERQLSLTGSLCQCDLRLTPWTKIEMNENRNLTQPLPLYSMTFLSIFFIHLLCRFPFTPMWAPDDNFCSKETLPFPAASQPSFFFAIYTTYRYLFVFQHTVEPPYNGHLGDRRKWPS